MARQDYTDFRLATRKEKLIVMNIVVEAFQSDPQLAWLLEKSNNKDKLTITIDYLVEEIFSRGSIYITNDNTGVTLWHTEKLEKINFGFIKRNILMPFKLGIPTVIRLIQNQFASFQHYQKGKSYCYLAIIGVLPEAQGKGLSGKLMNPILAEQKVKNTSVYLETANPTNVEIYKRKGFKLTEKIDKDTISIYYMRRD